MNKFTPILILLLIIGVVSVSGCIHYVDGGNSPSISDVSENNNPLEVLQGENNSDSDTKTAEKTLVAKVNKTGNIKIANESTSKNIKEKHQSNGNVQPKISKADIEKQVINILKSENPNTDFTTETTLVYIENKPIYIIDIYDNQGWYGYLEVDADNGPIGNDLEGYSFNGGAFRDEVNDEGTAKTATNTSNENEKNSLNSSESNLLPENEIKNIMDNELKTNYSIEESDYNINKFSENDTEFYNVTISALNKSSDKNISGNATINAKTGEIISLKLSEISEKIYSVDEAGDFVDIVYKGKKVSVRENYPYYSPQNDKIYYSAEEEAEDLYQMALEFD
ncbi:MAG: hypothetical protein VZR33_03015 [Methanosphaera sp.]|uniref:hypothetical protein n=1 Tax=Methanosphaera sp. TaxID=2666342 RepID=UPI002E75BEE3|nr:hypothetical protein [Methanosphaera sp.]MEE1116992.1 hypothetical protein [Methanosphaera sp.]MEE3324281.1 hypothetical protein [Methanosphaera sp.]